MEPTWFSTSALRNGPYAQPESPFRNYLQACRGGSLSRPTHTAAPAEFTERAFEDRYPLLERAHLVAGLERYVLSFSQGFEASSIRVIGVHGEHLVHEHQAIEPVPVGLPFPISKFLQCRHDFLTLTNVRYLFKRGQLVVSTRDARLSTGAMPLSNLLAMEP